MRKKCWRRRGIGLVGQQKIRKDCSELRWTHPEEIKARPEVPTLRFRPWDVRAAISSTQAHQYQGFPLAVPQSGLRAYTHRSDLQKFTSAQKTMAPIADGSTGALSRSTRQ